MARRTKKQAAEVSAELAEARAAASVTGDSGRAEIPTGEPGVSVDWIVREARRTYDAAHEAGSLSTAVSCLNLIGKHLSGASTGEEVGEAGVFIVTGIDGAPGSDADD